jgi:hypothetical protein
MSTSREIPEKLQDAQPLSSIGKQAKDDGHGFKFLPAQWRVS